jgi:hypothetical protein
MEQYRDAQLSTRRLRAADMDAAAAVYRISYDERLPWLAGRHTPEEDKAFFRTRIILDRLEVKGLIERKEYEGDARGQLIALTPKGRTLQKEMWPAYREAVKKQLNALAKHQVEDLSKLLQLLIRKEGG